MLHEMSFPNVAFAIMMKSHEVGSYYTIKILPPGGGGGGKATEE
jgi:hypothetical protein